MRSEIKKTTEVVLFLNEREAKWLKAYMQNKHFDSESAEDCNLRTKFFNALSEKQGETK